MKRALLAGVVLASLLFGSAGTAHADEPEAPPKERPRWDLVGAGAAVFTLSYGATAAWGATVSKMSVDDGPSYKHYEKLTIPVAGPFVVLAYGRRLHELDPVLLSTMAAGQIVGLGMVASGFVFQKKVAGGSANIALVPAGPSESAGGSMFVSF